MSACPRCCRSFDTRFALCPGCLMDPEELEPTRVASLQLHEELGRGGMGVVYRAHHIPLAREVAVKLMAADIAEHEEFQRRLEREAKILALLDHPNIVRVFDAGKDSGQLFLAMELVKGRPLSDLLSEAKNNTVPKNGHQTEAKTGHKTEARALPIVRALEIASQVAAALSHAHQRGVVHRDIKPSNILIAENGDVKVGDFGIARLVGGKAELVVTQTDVAVGSPAYMSPEAMVGAAPCPSMDIYSLGVLLYEMISGNLPIGVFPPLDGTVNSVVRKALATDPSQRYHSMDALGDAITTAAKHVEQPQTPRSISRRPIRKTWYAAALVPLGFAIWGYRSVPNTASNTASNTAKVIFQQGYNQYEGASDHWFSERAYERFHVSDYLRTSDWEEANQQAVLHFSNLFGSSPEHVPPTAKIERATLVLIVPERLQYADGESNAVHKMLVDWRGQGGWSAPPWTGGATHGIDRDDVEASVRSYDDSARYVQDTSAGPLIPHTTRIELNVTDIVLDWSHGQPNYGFLLQSSGDMNGNALFMASSRWPRPSFRPALHIVYKSQ